MIALLALLLAAQALPVEPVPTDEEIVVIGQRLDRIAVTVGRDPKGRYTCSLSDTSGNARLDAKLCKVSTKCVQKGARSGDQVKACVQKSKASLFSDFRREMAKRKA